MTVCSFERSQFTATRRVGAVPHRCRLQLSGRGTQRPAGDLKQHTWPKLAETCESAGQGGAVGYPRSCRRDHPLPRRNLPEHGKILTVRQEGVQPLPPEHVC